MKGYFVDRDAHGDLWIWRERGDYPVPVLSQLPSFRDDPELWDAIVALVESEQGPEPAISLLRDVSGSEDVPTWMRAEADQVLHRCFGVAQ